MECNDERTPDRVWPGLSVKTRSIQEVLFVYIHIGSFISWKKPFDEGNASKFDISVVLISSEHQEGDLASKSPAILVNAGLRLFMSLTSFSS